MIKTIGKHRVRHGNVMDRSGISGLMRKDRVDVMYSDPPWGQGNLRYWCTMNKKMNGAEVEAAPLDDFLANIFGIASTYVDRYLVVEYGQQWADMIEDYGVKAGFDYHGLVKIKYRGGGTVLPLDLHLFARPGNSYPSGYEANVRGSLGYDCVKRAFGPLAETVLASNPQAIALDPCCGMGYTAQASIDFGLSFRGNELNLKRLNKTIARLEKSLGK